MRDRTRHSLLFAAILLSTACSDDDKRETATDDGGSPVTGERDSGASSLVDASLDGGRTDIDGALAVPDASPPDASTDSDASADAGATPDAGALCSVNDPKYGCGKLTGSTWLSFPDFDVDLVNKVAWTKPVTVFDDDELAGICPGLNNGGLKWELPQMEDVRKLAAGCPETLPGGACQVYLDEVLTANAGDCQCDASLVGPNAGKFCRADVPECETFWVWTHTYETGYYQHWFYDVKTGSIVPEYVAVGIALEAKGRCVHELADTELPAILKP